MNLSTVIEYDKKYYMNTFGDRTPVSFEYGKGIYLWDSEGKKYIDLFSGIAVNALGHSHPKLVKALKEQVEKLIHCSNLYYIENQAKLAKLLVESSCADKVFFANSGAEANEGAIKLARKYFKSKGLPGKYEIIALTNSFHGRTITTATATGQDKYKEPYTPLTPGFKHVPLNDFEALREAITDATCAILLEPIQGESGVNPLNQEYIRSIRDLCSQSEILLIFDEVQSGMGRTGKLFGYQHFGVEPDIFTLAKALGGGVPIGALCAKDFVAKAFDPGDHGSTFGGNPFACAAGIAVMDVLLNDGLIENAEKVGTYFMESLRKLAQKLPVIREVRGKGLMIGVEFSIDKAKEIKEKCFGKGYLIGNVGSRVLRILPPLILTEQDVDGFIATLSDVLSDF
ncbi:MAG: acetylornithine transaminase [Clostridia bacterium]|nr:acetylornithine transaminase [Clostridia bacterium]